MSGKHSRNAVFHESSVVAMDVHVSLELVTSGELQLLTLDEHNVLLRRMVLVRMLLCIDVNCSLRECLLKWKQGLSCNKMRTPYVWFLTM